LLRIKDDQGEEVLFFLELVGDQVLCVIFDTVYLYTALNRSPILHVQEFDLTIYIFDLFSMIKPQNHQAYPSFLANVRAAVQN